MPSAPTPTKPPSRRNIALVTLLCTAAAGTCIQLTQASEGYVPKAKSDPAGILTGCYGERVDQSNLDPNKVYSESECGDRLRQRLAKEYAPKIAACLPELVDERRVKVFGALLDAAFNAGPSAVCKSRMAVAIHAENWAGGCDGFYGWRATALDRRTHKRIALKGLQTRRAREAALCKEGL